MILKCCSDIYGRNTEVSILTLLLTNFTTTKCIYFTELSIKKRKKIMSTNEDQMARSILREKFLKAINKFSGIDCDVHMYENTTVKCTVKAFDPNFENVVVENLKTPMMAPVKKAVLRTSDILTLEFRPPCEFMYMDFVK